MTEKYANPWYHKTTGVYTRMLATNNQTVKSPLYFVENFDIYKT